MVTGRVLTLHAMTRNQTMNTAHRETDSTLRERAGLSDTLAESLSGRSLVLVGLMGAGKTSIGRRLAGRLGLPFHDADAEIEQAAGCAIPELFERFGEAEFRKGERRVIARLLAGDPIVLATGGGAYMDPETRAAIRREGLAVWLRCKLPTLVRRVGSSTNRPLLRGGDPAQILAGLMEKRYPIYAEADVIVDCGDEPPDVTTSKVLDAVQSYRPHRKLSVRLSTTSYDVAIGPGLIARAGAQLAAVLPQKRAFIVSDETVAGLYLPQLRASLAECGFSTGEFIIPPGEGSKTLETYQRLVGAMLEAKVERRTSVIALGGGVVGDLAGFAAATTLRGLPFVQIPTTLLSQVDSSVGGKTGVNSPWGKNLIGAFHQPRMVLADAGALSTLPARELRAGYAEIVKAGLIGDARLFEWCERNGALVLGTGTEEQIAEARGEAVLRACAFKAAVVGDDEREEKPNDGRALLNLGHTFGHALEAEFGYDGTLLHGEAVGIGLGLAFMLSARIGLCAPEDAQRVTAHLASVGMLARIGDLRRPLSAARLLAHMKRDKKMRDGALHFVLARGIGQGFTSSDVAEQDVRALLIEEGCGD